MSRPDPTARGAREHTPSHAALVALLRDEGTRVLATLIRVTGSLQLAEDSVQDAVVRALETWPRDGVPTVPRAWLTTAARRCAVDIVRRESHRTDKEAAAMAFLDLAAPSDPLPGEDIVADDLLRLVFTCCHPALSMEAQIALSLRTLCGLTTAEVARALLVPEATMTKRLTRAKQKIARAAIPYRVPAVHELPDRVAGVAACVYLLFNEGYSASADAALVRADLTDEALRLGRLLVALMPDEPSLLGLLALMLLHDSRRGARTDPAGDLVLLVDQDRAKWDARRIREGVLLLGDGLRRTPTRPDPYVVQAAIAACHALAPSFDRTDWSAVVSWYDVLLSSHDTSVARLNRAVAIGERDGPEVGLIAVEAVTGLTSYALWHASRAELLARVGRSAEAVLAWRDALALESNEVTRRHLERRLAELS